MSEVTIYNIAGDKTGSVDIEPASITEGVSPILLHRAVVSYEANARQGSANTKTRGERSGSGKKRRKGYRSCSYGLHSLHLERWWCHIWP